MENKVISLSFSYGYHKWGLAFSRQEKTLGVYLMWRDPSPGMKVIVDLSLTLLNRDHFSQNINFSRKKVKFNMDAKGKLWVEVKFLGGVGVIF